MRNRINIFLKINKTKSERSTGTIVASDVI
jgi:hypothetical protein